MWNVETQLRRARWNVEAIAIFAMRVSTGDVPSRRWCSPGRDLKNDYRSNDSFPLSLSRDKTTRFHRACTSRATSSAPPFPVSVLISAGRNRKIHESPYVIRIHVARSGFAPSTGRDEISVRDAHAAMSEPRSLRKCRMNYSPLAEDSRMEISGEDYRC
jgi:hypothetical protein